MSNISVFDAASGLWKTLHDMWVNDAGTYKEPKRVWVFSTADNLWHEVGNFTIPGTVPITSFTKTSSILGGPNVTVQWTVQTDSTQDDYSYNVQIEFFRNGSIADSYVVPQTAGLQQSMNYTVGDNIFARLFYSTPDHSGATSDTATLTMT